MSQKKFGPSDDFRAWARGIQDIMDEMRNRSFFDYRATGTWLPNINIYETPSAYIVCVELAGLDPECVAVQFVDPQHVCITGQRQRTCVPELREPFSIDLMEIDEGPFQREVDFSQRVATDAIEARYDNGYLWIKLRKTGTE
jgi:HSP20 family molecular chaperone IbpA